jgi:hypothetical protein
MNEGVLEAARAIRPYLDDLVGPAAAEFDARIATLLAAATAGVDVVPELQSILGSPEGTSSFLEGVLADGPLYRPPEWQPPSYRELGYQSLAGDVGPIRHAGKYRCLKGDYVWYRPTVGTDIRSCPTHGLVLVRT